MKSSNYRDLHRNQSTISNTELWIALALCITVPGSALLKFLLHNSSSYTGDVAPAWLLFAAVGISAVAIIQLLINIQWHRLQQTLSWIGIFLLVWIANGLPLDLLRLTPLIPLSIDWPGVVTKTSALAAAIIIMHIELTRPAPSATKPVIWYGYAAFLLALPYPIMRTCWALGGTPGLVKPGAAGEGFIPWLACIPWLMAAVLSLLLIYTPRRIPRRLLLTAGWFATAVVMLIGPGACWTLLTKLLAGEKLGLDVGMAPWVPCLFYGSWLLWAIAAGAATHSYQLRSELIKGTNMNE